MLIDTILPSAPKRKTAKEGYRVNRGVSEIYDDLPEPITTSTQMKNNASDKSNILTSQSANRWWFF